MALDRIFFDARFIRWDHHDGISRFSTGLVTALSRRIKVTALISDKRQLLRLPKGIEHALINEPTHPSELWVARKLNKLGARFVFSPMQTMGSWGRRYKLVLTLHDLIYYNHPKPPPGFNPIIRFAWRVFHAWYWPQRLILGRADAVATVSLTTRALIERHSLSKKPVEVIYNAAGSFLHDYEHTVPTSRPRGKQTLVYMGSFMDYKNVELLIAGLDLLPSYELHLMSKIEDDRRAELTALAGENAARVVFHDGVSEAEYHRAIDSAVALVTASRDEGFGIPLVESMSRGVPVIVSDIPIFREIGGAAASFFDVDSSESFARAVKELGTNPEWLRRSRASLEQAARFNWDRSAAALIQLAERLT